MPSAQKLEKKETYILRIHDMLAKYDKAFIVHADNVGSKQFQDIRAALRPLSVVLMGKNSLIKRAIRSYVEETGDNKWEILLPEIVGNIGLIFTEASLTDVRDTVNKFEVPAPARVGAITPCDVVVPAGNTGMGPEATGFFQVLNIATKINKGQVEIINDVNVLKVGDKVDSSQSALLMKMNIMPFTYGLVLVQVIEGGSMFSPKVLDITDDDIMAGFQAGLRQVTALSLGANYPTLCAVPHLIINGYKNVLAVAVETDYTFPLAEKVKAYLADPSAFASAAPVAAASGAAAKAPEPEPEEEEEEDMGFDLFD